MDRVVVVDVGVLLLLMVLPIEDVETVPLLNVEDDEGATGGEGVPTLLPDNLTGVLNESPATVATVATNPAPHTLW